MKNYTTLKIGLGLMAIGAAIGMGTIFAMSASDYEPLQRRNNELTVETAGLQGKVDEQFAFIQEAMAARGITIPESAQGYCGTGIAPSQLCSYIDVLGQLDKEGRRIEQAIAVEKPRYTGIIVRGLGAGGLISLSGMMITWATFYKGVREGEI
ncbi:TPA: hypothetical protein HA231_01480 [Candidatus Woesearchaeota archaeon]|nr:hypothetical protein [Candidatus Woesearchaeota archaeon]